MMVVRRAHTTSVHHLRGRQATEREKMREDEEEGGNDVKNEEG